MSVRLFEFETWVNLHPNPTIGCKINNQTFAENQKYLKPRVHKRMLLTRICRAVGFQLICLPPQVEKFDALPWKWKFLMDSTQIRGALEFSAWVGLDIEHYGPKNWSLKEFAYAQNCLCARGFSVFKGWEEVAPWNHNVEKMSERHYLAYLIKFCKLFP